jgi:hypothetical protein
MGIISEMLIKAAHEAQYLRVRQSLLAVSPSAAVALLAMEVRLLAGEVEAVEAREMSLTAQVLSTRQKAVDTEAALRRIAAQLFVALQHDVPDTVLRSSAAHTTAEIQALLDRDSQPQKFSRPRGDFLRVFEGGAVKR